MQYSQALPDFLKRPNIESVRLIPYRDPRGIMTAGVGHKLTSRDPTGPWTMDMVLAQLALDLDATQSQVNAALDGTELTQCEFDAVCSFTFNLGIKRFAGSTLLMLLKKGDIQGAADEFPRWDHDGGLVIPGLRTRRMLERAMFLGQPY